MKDDGAVRPEKYCAFISYSHQDARWARWLQGKIERFRVPASLLKHAGGQSRLGRVFRDRDELSAGVLSEKLQAALLESGFLIVICSPATPDSRYVIHEIDFFKAHRPFDRIIPFIVGGMPRAGSHETPGVLECLPEQLRVRSATTATFEDSKREAATLDLLGPDARSIGDGSRRAFVKLMAAMLGVDFDLLWQREKRRRIQRICVSILLISLLACSFVALQAEHARRRGEDKARHEEAQRSAEKKRLAQLAEKDFQRGCAVADEGKNDEALAWLARAVRSAQHVGAAARISSLLLEGRWTLPVGAHVLKGQNVTAAVFDANGQRFATVTMTDGGSARSAEAWQVWETETGRAISPSIPAPDSIASVAFHPDGRSLLIAAGKEVRLLNPVTAQAIGHPLVCSGKLAGAIFGPGGKSIVTYARDGNARIWDTATQNPLSPDLVHNAAVTTAAINKEGNLLACGTEKGSIYRWSFPSGQPVRKPLSHPGQVNSLQFDFLSGNTLLSGSSNGNVILWLYQKDESAVSFSHGKERMGGTAISPDGSTILTYGDDWALRIWSLLQGKQIEDLKHGKEVMSASFCPDGMSAVSGSRDGTVHLTGIGSGQIIPPLQLGAPISVACFSLDGSRLLTASRGNGVRIWNMSSRRVEPQLLLSTSTVSSARFSPDGLEIVTAGNKGKVQFWPIGSLSPTRELPQEDGEVFDDAIYSANGKVLVTSGTRVRAWAADALKLIGVAPVDLEQGVSLTVSSDGSNVLAKSRGHPIRRWQPKPSGGTIAEVPVLEGAEHISFNGDGSSFFVANDHQVRFHHTESLARTGQLEIPEGGISSVEYSPDGKSILVGMSSGVTQLFSAPAGRLLRTLDPGSPPIVSEERRDGKNVGMIRLQESSVVSLAHFDASGRRIVVGRMNNAAYIWDATTGEQIVNPLVHKAGIHIAAFSPTGEFLVTGTDGPTRLWHVGSGLLTAPITQNTDVPIAVEWRKDGSAYLTLGQEGELKVFHRFAAEAPPIWLADVAEAYSGWRLGGERNESLLPVDRHETWARLQGESSDLKDNEPWSRLAHWLFAGNGSAFPATPNGGPPAPNYFAPCRDLRKLNEACWRQIGRTPFGDGTDEQRINKRHYELKLARLANALDYFPGDPRFLAGFAEIYSETTLENVAAQFRLTAISALAARLGPQDAEVQRIHSAILNRGNMQQEALVYLQRALALDPDSVDVQLHAGYLLGSSQDKERAIQHFTQAIEIVRRSHLSKDLEKGALRNRAMLYVLLKRETQAAADVAELLRLEPEFELPPQLKRLKKTPSAE
jgi:WD40 repeat protein/tetratricopeptide (TPR) repeat protein